MNPSLPASLSNIRLLILDVDGVLTDGRIYVDTTHENIKAFHVRDGLGIKLLQKAGIEVAIITGKASEMVRVRAETLGIKRVFQGQENKLIAFAELLETLEISPQQVAYIGDDLPDIAVMSKVGFSAAVSDAHPSAIMQAHYRSQFPGGAGAVREICDLILEAQEKLQPIQQAYLHQGKF